MKNKILMVLLLGLVGCEKSEQQKIDEKRRALDLQVQNIVRENLKDGDSAKFRNQYEMCGEVNAKNSFGAYTGFTRYILTSEKLFLENQYQESDYSIKAFQQVWSSTCS